ncbi:MAG: BspA family leucine-rich repeat surface protein, partial [Lachnospiraceae bacterium]|nr:BspA family leucine-rich repeat surface protein [Lachnospiraceae bacterium]
DLSQLNTANVTNMKQMFDDCSGFTNIDVSSFDTTNVKKMRDMFNNCTNLTTIDVSNFKTANVTDMYGMFASDSADYKLTTIYVSNDFVTSAVRDGDYMFYNRRAICGGQDTVYGDIVDHTYARIDDPDHSKPGYFTDKNQTLGAAGLYYTLKAEGSEEGVLRLYGHANGTIRTEITSNALDSSEYMNTSLNMYADRITKVIVMEDIYPISMENAFSGCSSLKSIENADRIHTENVTSMASAFEGCSVLTTLDLTSFDTSNVTEMANMFARDAKLTTIYVSDAFDVTKVTDDVNAATGEGNMFTGCVSLVGGLGTRVSLGSSEYNPLDKSYAWPDGKNDKPGYFTSRDIVDTSELYYDYNNLTGTLTFYKTAEEGRRRVAGGKMNSNVYLDSAGNSIAPYSVHKIVFENEIYPTDMNRAFKEMSSLETFVNLGNLKTRDVKNMDSAFYAIGVEGELDLSGLDLSNVTSMADMFYTSDHLTSVKLSGATEELTNMSEMFIHCDKLETVTFTNFDSSNVTDMSRMFMGCEALTSPSVAGLNTSSVTTMESMYEDCKKLTSFNMTGFSTARVTTFKEMFRNSGITSVNASLFDTANATDFSYMFAYCKDLTSLDLTSFDTTKATTFAGMFYAATKLASVDLSSFDTTYVTDMSNMFNNCTSLTKLDLSSFGTARVTDMSLMFYTDNDDYKLTTIIASNNFVTTALDVNQGKDAYMFKNRRGIVGGQGTGYNDTYVGWEYAHIDDAVNSNFGYFTDPSDTPTAGLYYNMVVNGGDVILRLYSESGGGRTPLPNGELNSSLYTVTVDRVYNNADITKVMIMDNISPASVEHAFDGCTALKEITDIDKLHIDNLTVASLAYMFNGCEALTELDLTSFNTAAITDMTSLFAGCSKLETIYVSDDFVTTSVTADADMFDGCTSLVGGYGTRPYYNASNPAYELGKTYARIDSSTTQGFFTKKGDVAASIYYGFTEAGTGEYVLTLYADSIKGVTEELPKGSIRSDAFANRIVSQDKIVKVVIADDIYPTNMACAFMGLENVESFEGMDMLHTENVRDMTGAFAECSSLMEIDLSNFDTSKVLNMKGMFYDCSSMATLNVGSFNTANVTNMENMFCMSSSGLLGTIYASTSFVTTGLPNAMTMFGNTPILCGGNGTEFNAANVNSAYARIDSDATPGYFSDATMLATTGVYYTLLVDDRGDYALQLFAHPGGGRKQLPYDELNSDYYLPTKDTSITTAPKDSIILVIVNDDIYPKNMESAFDGVRDGNSEPLMFMNIDKIHTENVTSMKRAFAECFVSRGNTNELDLSSFDTSKVTDMSEMFAGNTELEKVNLTGFDTSKVTAMANMFDGCSSLETIYVSDTFTVANLTDGGTDMFSGCNKLVGQAGTCTIYPDGTASAYPLDKRSAIIDGTGTNPTPGFFTDGVNGDTSSIYYSITTEDMCVLLLYATPGTGRTKLENGVINYKNFAFPMNYNNTSVQRIVIEEDIYPRNMVFAFNGMNPQNGDFYGLDKLHTENVMDMTNAFSGFTLLSELDLSGFNTANVRSMAGMFKNSTGLNKIYASAGFVTTNVTDSTDMFAGCTNLSGPNTAYDASNVDATYACADGISGAGYFTAKINGTLTVTGIRQVGQTLTANFESTDDITNAGTLTITWHSWSTDRGTGSTYVLTDDDRSDDLYCTVTTDNTVDKIDVVISKNDIMPKSSDGGDVVIGVDTPDGIPVANYIRALLNYDEIDVVTLKPNEDDPSLNIVTIDDTVTIPSGKTLVVWPGVTLIIGDGVSDETKAAIVNVSDRSIHNFGTIVVSSNGMLVNGDEENPGRIVNYEGGKILIEGTFENVNGTIENAGEITNIGQVQNKENGLLKGGLENAYGGLVENDGTIQTPEGEQAVTEGFGAYIGNPEVIGDMEEENDVQEDRTETEEPGTGSGTLEGQEAGEEGASQVEPPHFTEVKVGPSDEEYAKVKKDADDEQSSEAADDADKQGAEDASTDKAQDATDADEADKADGTDAGDDKAQSLEEASDADKAQADVAQTDAAAGDDESGDSKDGDLPTEDAKKPEDLDLPKQDALKPEDALKPDDLADLDGEPQGDPDETGSTDETSAAEEPADEATTAADDENA